ncbi:hypothetical protein CRM94_16995 [Burkholderia gladioli]|uniref:Uncharacterized protein n=1 Tax=Burkholderia gladioli TaxID=28095 RepID=A0A2A7SB03_BURGA|nr:hypothetical protein CRM94_16995 [Burkholderia gladioli]
MDDNVATSSAAGGHVRDAGAALKRELLGTVSTRTSLEVAVALGIDAVFGAWASLRVQGDAAKFVDHLENAWLLETLETQLKERRSAGFGAEYELYRDWLTPFRRPANPADPMGGQIDTLKLGASFGDYMNDLRKLARGTPAKASATATVRDGAVGDTAAQPGKRKWFDRTTAQGRKERWLLAAILAVFAAVWTHTHWSHQQPAASAADAAQSDESSN